MMIMKLIDKDTLVGEIERRISTYKRHYEELVRYEVWNDAKKKIEPKINELENLLSFINTLEVKEVNLEKEVHKFIDKMEKYNKNDDNWVVDYRFYPEQGYCRSWLTNKKENEYR